MRGNAATGRTIGARAGGQHRLARAARAAVEHLERRTLFNTFTPAAGDWNLAANWSDNQVPSFGATVDVPAGRTVTVSDTEYAATVTVEGTLHVAAGGNINFNNGAIDGTVTVDAGGTYTAGRFSALDPANAGLTVTLRGTANVSGSLTGALLITPAATLNLTGGSIGGEGENGLANQGTINVTGPADATIAAPVTNYAALTVAGPGDLLLGGTQLYNEVGGTVSLAADGTDLRPSGGGGTLVNRGTVRKTGGAGTSTLNPGYQLLSDGGTFASAAGTLSVGDPDSRTGQDMAASGTTSFNATAAGATVAVYMSGGFSGPIAGAGPGHLLLGGGTLSRSNAAADGFEFDLPFAPGYARVSGSQFTDAVNVGDLTYVNAADLQTGDGSFTFTNRGTIEVAGAGNLTGSGNGSQFVNDTGGLIDLQTDAGLTGNGGNESIVNRGTIRKSGGAGTSELGFGSYGTDNDGGTIDVRVGTLKVAQQITLTNGVTLLVATGAALAFESNVTLPADAPLTTTGGGVTRFEGTGGYGTADRDKTATFAFAPGTLVMAGGTFGNGSLYANAGDMQLTNGFREDAATLTNTGTLTFAEAGTYNVGNLLNAAGGTVTIAADVEFSILGDHTDNLGTVVFAGPGQSVFRGIAYPNHGTVQVNGGSALFNAGTSVMDEATHALGGNWSVTAGATLQIDPQPGSFLYQTDTTIAADPVRVVAGTVGLSGPGATFVGLDAVAAVTGTLAVTGGASLATAGSVGISGTLSVGGPVTVAGALNLSGTLNLDASANPGQSGAPTLTVAGPVQLGGKLTATTSGGFAAATGTAYTAATFPSSSGTFADTTGVGPLFTASVGPTTITLNGQGSPGTGGGGAPALSASAVSGPASAAVGDVLSIPFTVANAAGAATATGSWIDSVYLSADGTLDATDTLIGRATEPGPLAAGGTYTGTLTAALPPVVDGTYQLLLVADSTKAIPDVDRADNVIASAAAITVGVPVLTVGTPLPVAVPVGTDGLYRVDVPAGQAVRLTVALGSAYQARVTTAAGRLPAASDPAAPVTDATNTTVAVTLASAGPNYARLSNLLGTTGTATLSAAVADFGLFAATPNAVGQGPVTLTVAGAGLATDTAVALVDGNGTSVASATVTPVDGQMLYAKFDLTTVTPGAYTLRAATAAGRTADAPAPVTVAAGVSLLGGGGVAGAAGLQPISVHLTGPGTIRPNATGTITVDYFNPNAIDVPAPLLVINGDNATFNNTGTSSIQVLAHNAAGPAGTLTAGARGSLSVSFRQTSSYPHSVSFEHASLTVPTADAQLPLDWSLMKTDLRPADIADAAWDAVYANFTSVVGNTRASYTAALDAIATDLSAHGDRTTGDAAALVHTLLQVADNFGAITARYTDGGFGYGRPDPYNVTAATAANGVVSVRRGGQIVYYTPTGAANTYASANPGDGGGTITKAGDGSYTLAQPGGRTTGFTAAGNLAYADDGAGHRTTFATADNRVTAVTTSTGDTTTIAYDGTGHITAVTDAVGRTTTYAYDGSGNLTSVATAAGATTYAYANPASHAVTAMTRPDGTGVAYGYDPFGRLTSTANLDGSTPVTTSYSPAGGTTTTNAAGQSTTVSRSSAGAIISVTDAAGHRVTASTTATSSTVNDDGYAAGGTFTAAGDPAAASANGSPAGRVGYDAAGRVASVTDAGGHTTAYAYDAAGRLASVTDPAGAATAYSYGSAAQTVKSAGGRSVTTTTTAAGQVTSQTLGNGGAVAYTYDGHRNVLTATNAVGTVTFTYDAADRITGVTYPSGLSLTYTYDAGGRLTRRADGGGFATSYAYDAAGRLAAVTDAGGATLITYAYDAVGQVIRATAGNGTSADYTYDRAGNVASVVNRAAGGAVQSSFAYTYGPANRVATMTTAAGTTAYGYDGLGQLTRVALPGGRTITYAYDAAGNRTSVTDSAAATTAYAANALNQITAAGSATFTYDADGNLLTRTDAAGTTTYGYDGLNQLVSVAGPTGTTAYAYDALGNRVSQTVNGTTTNLLVDPTAGRAVVGQYTAGGAAVARYAYGRGLVAATSAAGANSYYQFDAQGNTAATTNASGTIVDAYTYLPFGEHLTSTGSAPNPFTFAGRSAVVDRGDGTFLTRTRLYDAGLGRFTQRDPVGLLGQDANLYRYVSNAPTVAADPSGHLAEAFELSSGFVGLNSSVILYRLSQALIEVATVNPFAAGPGITADALLGTLGAAESTGVAATGAGLAIDFELIFAETGLSALPGVNLPAVFEPLATLTLPELPAGAAVGLGVPSALNGLATVGGLTGFGTGVAATTGAALLAGPALAFVAAVKANQYLDQQFPDGIPVAEQSTVNLNDAYKRAIRDPLGQLLVKQFRTDNPGRPLTQDELTLILKLVNQSQRVQRTEAVTSTDPNDLVGPAGGGAARYVGTDGSLPYTIDFQNQPTADAAASHVSVTTTLDANVDLASFYLTDIGFGTMTIDVPDGLQRFSTRVSYAEPGNGAAVLVDVAASLNVATRVVTWTFDTLDPTTLDTPADPAVGFLPPDAADDRGRGFVGYAVRPLATAAGGTVVTAAAGIVFDANAPIATNTWTNTLDVAGPTSAVAPLPTTAGTTAIPVTWAGSDDNGIANYTLFVSVDGGSFVPWLTTAATSATYLAAAGHAYGFYSVATDLAGNEQPTPAAAQATTTVPAIARTLTVSAGRPARFTDAAGNAVTVTLSGAGTGTLGFVSAANADPVSFALAGTTVATRVNVRAAGPRGSFTLTDVSVDGSLAAFAAPAADLVGSFTVAGTLGSLSAYNVDGGAVTVGGAGVATAFRFNVVHDLTLATAAPVRSLVAASWTDAAYGTDALSAPSVGTLRVGGDFDPTVTLSGGGLALRSATVRGSLSGTGWTVAAGSVGTITVGGDDTAPLTAVAVRSLRVGRDLTGAVVTLTGTAGVGLATLAVTGTVTNSTVTAAADVGTVTVGGMVGSSVLAGVTAVGLPTSAEQLSGGKSIRSVVDRGRSPFADSVIAASAIGSVALRSVTTANGGVPFGVAAHTLRAFSLAQPGARPVRYAGKALTGSLDDLGGDLRVRLL